MNKFRNAVPIVAASILVLLALTWCNRPKIDGSQSAQNPQTTDSSKPTSNQNPNQSSPTMNAAPPLPVYIPEIIRTIPHDPEAFTQGLCFYKGELYESTGQYASSSLRKVDWNTGKVLKQINVPAEFFAEGMAIVNDQVFQLTWREQTCFVYDAHSFKAKRTLSYFGEGWGLTNDGEFLIMSDGSNLLRFMDTTDLSVRKTIPVTYEANGYTTALKNLNELEFIKGEVYANVWFSDSIARINPTTGKVTGWIDMSSLISTQDRQENNVLNGVAYDPKRDRMLVTGKLWSKMFEVKLKLRDMPVSAK